MPRNLHVERFHLVEEPSARRLLPLPQLRPDMQSVAGRDKAEHRDDCDDPPLLALLAISCTFLKALRIIIVRPPRPSVSSLSDPK
jgi:hypothetical protein